MNAKISIIIPVYNAEKYLGECLDSVLGQTLRELEVICVDDGSTDDSLRILDERGRSDSRLFVVRQENAGAGVARNRGIAAATGEFVAFMDADDLYPNSEVLARLYSDAIESRLPVVCGQVELLEPNGSLKIASTGFPQFVRRGVVDFRESPFDWGYQACLFSRKLLIDNDLRFPLWRRYQDPPFLVRTLLTAKLFFADPMASYRYRVEYKKIDWTANGCRKIIDLLQGVRDEMTVATQQGVASLCRMISRRCQLQFGTVFCSGLCRSEDVRRVAFEIKQEFPDLLHMPLCWLALRGRIGLGVPYVMFKAWWMLRNEGLGRLVRRIFR